jgi:hypothetical protein
LETRLSSLESFATPALDAEEDNTLELQVKEAVAKRAPLKREDSSSVAFDAFRTG